MFKTLAIASAILISGVGFGAGAAEIGIRQESGSSRRAVSHGRESMDYKVVVNGASREVDVNVAAGGAGSITPPTGALGVAGTFNRKVTTSTNREVVTGTSSNRFNGGSNSTFSSTTVFSN